MDTIIKKSEFRALAAALVVILLLEFFFGGLSLQITNLGEKARESTIAGAILAFSAPPAPKPWVNPDAGSSSVIGAPAPSWSDPALDAFGGPGPTINAPVNPTGGLGPGGAGGVSGGGGSAAGQAGAQVGAQAAACVVPAGGVAVPHQQCQTPATTNGTPCGPIPTPGGVIQGICAAGCCTAAGFTAPQSAIMSFAKSIGIGVAISGITGAIGQLFGGGGGGGDYGGYNGAWSQYQSPYGGTSHLLDFDDDSSLPDSGTLGGFDALFGNGKEDNSTNLEYGTSLVNQVSGPDGDTVTTSYENIKNTAEGSKDVAPIPGDTELERDFNSSTFSDTELTFGDRLSLADLESDAAAARRREALRNEQEGAVETGNIRDYRSSNVSQSGSNSDTETDGSDTENRESWWQSLLLFIGSLLGL